MGDPNDPNNMLGALVSKEHMTKVKGYVELARQEGCSILCGDGVENLALPEKNQNVRLYRVLYRILCWGDISNGSYICFLILTLNACIYMYMLYIHV